MCQGRHSVALDQAIGAPCGLGLGGDWLPPWAQGNRVSRGLSDLSLPLWAANSGDDDQLAAETRSAARGTMILTVRQAPGSHQPISLHAELDCPETPVVILQSIGCQASGSMSTNGVCGARFWARKLALETEATEQAEKSHGIHASPICTFPTAVPQFFFHACRLTSRVSYRVDSSCRAVPR